MKNPFYYQGDAPAEFCYDRLTEMKRLRSAADNGQRIRIRGDRRIGKTTLVNQAISKGRLLIKVDFGAVRTLDLANERIAIALKKATETRSLFSKMRVMLNAVDEIKLGPMTIKGARRTSSTESSLSHLLEVVGEMAKRRRVAVFFDEIQDLMDVDGSESYLWELRGITQSQHNVPYIFAGSNRHMMRRMFDDSKAPFFKQTYDFELAPIEESRFVGWIVKRFAATGKAADPEIFEHVYRICRGVAGDVQCVAYHIWESEQEGERALTDALRRVIGPKRGGYQSIHASLKKSLKLMVKALAVMGGKEPTGKRVVGSVGLSGGTARAALKGLEKRGLVFDSGNGYVFDDPFFRLWLMALDPMETQRMYPESEDWPVVSQLVWD